MKDYILGIDPGITGAIAVYGPEADYVLGVWDMPTCERLYGKGLQVDPVGLYRLIYQDIQVSPEHYRIAIENVGPMPKQGVTSSFNFGHSIGILQGVLAGTGIDVEYIHPVTWKKMFGLVGSGKDECRQMVIEAYFDQAHNLRLKKHQGRADAIAIAVAADRISRGQ